MTNLQKMDNLARKVDKMADNLSLAYLLPLSGCKRKVRENNAHYATNC